MSNALHGIGHHGPSSPSHSNMMPRLPRHLDVVLSQLDLRPKIVAFHTPEHSATYSLTAVSLSPLVCAFGGPAPSDATHRPTAGPRSRHHYSVVYEKYCKAQSSTGLLFKSLVITGSAACRSD
ncbi:hypothetical protein J3459_016437 [Metarhizium acridum]|nr:hypothetical protein J3459_016437 [Metarhizium acridum]